MKKAGAGFAPAMDEKKQSMRTRLSASPGLLLFAVVLSAASVPRLRTVDEKTSRPTDPLPQILAKTKEYCARVATASLYFVCRETIDERQYDPPLQMFLMTSTRPPSFVIKISLEYDYQLIGSGDAVEEKRVLFKENGKPKNESNAVLKTNLYKHKYLVFGPVGILGEFYQPRHVYKYLGEDVVEKEKTFLIEAGPTGPPEPNLLYGKVWVRQRDFAIVKIEWDQHSLGNFETVRHTAEILGRDIEPRVSIVGYYGIEKNGLRFVDRLTVREDYECRLGILRASETRVFYKDYKFFRVETEVRY